MPEKFNYVIGAVSNGYCTEGYLSCYAVMNQVFWSDQEEAEAMLAYVKGKSPEKDWKICPISIPE